MTRPSSKEETAQAARGAWRLVLLAAALCVLGPQHARGQQQVDAIVRGGTIFTADDLLSIHDAMAVDDGRVVTIGSGEQMDGYRSDCTIDLDGRFVVPGFVDAHTHISGVPKRFVDMSGVGSIGAFQERLRAKAEELGPGAWITGYGWSEAEMEAKRKPTREDLDAALPDNPAVIARAGGHSAVLNSEALERAGIDEATPDPEGGLIERGDDGRPTGIIRENWQQAARLIPEPDPDVLRASLIERLRAQFAYGITSVVEAKTPPGRFARWQSVYDEHRGSLPRASVQIFLPLGEGEGEAVAARVRAMDLRTGQGDEHLRVGALKLMVDGGFTGPAAWTLDPYRDQPDYRGHARMAADDLYQVVRAAHEEGWQLGVHAIGDAAIQMTVEQIARVLDEQPRAGHRHYLNHFTVLPPDSVMRRMADHNILIVQQPNFTWTLDDRYARHLGGERLRTNNALRTPMSRGIFMALSADVLPTGPLLGIETAVTRRGMSGEVRGAEEALSVPEALAGYTRNGAYVTFEEDTKGTLEPGKRADFAVLARDLRRVPPDSIRDVAVDLTALGGQVVYERTAGAVPEACKGDFLLQAGQ